jgi:hypothetical protein
LGLRLNRAGSLSGLCVQQGIPLRSNDTDADPRVDRDACRRVGVASMVYVPLLLPEGTAIGVLKVLSNTKWAFKEGTVALLRLLVRIIAMSIHQASAHERTAAELVDAADSQLYDEKRLKGSSRFGSAV